MSEENRCVVTLNKGVDTEQFVNQMLDNGYTLHDDKPGSKRNFDFIMTLEQAQELRKDPRVVDVRYGSKADNGIFPVRATLDSSRRYTKTTALNSTHYNWGMLSCSSGADPFSPTITEVDYNFPYTVTGQGVDIVIQDSGVQPNHPEWLAQDGITNRYQSIDWPTEAGLTGTYIQPTNHERDVDGHGTHVAGTAAGRLYGWAKEANIYSIKILDDPGETYGVSASFNLIRGWHNNKTNGRPTVVNMSWGYFSTYTGITGGTYRGTPWTGNTIESQYGMVQAQQDGNGNWTYPVRVASVDADIQDCLDDGIILIGAAGNDSHKADVVGGLDYDNHFINNSGLNYYHRGSTPMGQPGVISVGNISYVYVNNEEPLFNSSTKGPRVDICAPGGFIMSAIPEGSNIAVSTGTVNYPLDSNFKSTKISGTSMASPQVAGVVACLMESRKNYTQTQVANWLYQNCENNRLHDPTTGTPSTDYQNFRALQGAPNRYLKTPFTSQYPFRLINGLSLS